MIFSNDWFNQNAKIIWDKLIPTLKINKILEIGSYEGRSLCYLIELLGKDSDLEVHAIDTWGGGEDQVSKRLASEVTMSEVEKRFILNTQIVIENSKHKIDLHVHKGSSDLELSKLLSSGYRDYFDFIYVDGSHETTDTLLDATLAFRLLKKGGTMIIDDYLWHVDTRDNYRPKLAIDAFVNLHFHQLDIYQTNNAQMYILKRTQPIVAMK